MGLRMEARISRLLREGEAVGAEIPPHGSGYRAFVRVNRLPKGGYSVVRYEMSIDVIAELEERWDRNEDYLNKQSATVDDLALIDQVLQEWGLDPNILVPAWQVDAP